MNTKENYIPDSNRYDGRMPYKKCGNSGISLPLLSLGMWHNFGSVDNLENCVDILHTAFDNGITCFDLANNYGPLYGTAEETFGTVYERSFKPYRDELFLVTKAGYDMWSGPYGDGGSRKYLISSLNQSLKRMKVDYVDLFYSHRYDPNTPLEETMQALVDIVRSGKALYVGISNYPLHTLQFVFSYLKEHDVPCLIYQGKYNIFHRQPETEGILEACKDAGVGFTAFSPLAQGLLTDRYLNGIPADSRMARNFFLKRDVLTEELLQQISALDEVAKDRGQTLSAMALSWLLQNSAVTSAIIGASSSKQLKANIKSVENINFSESELHRIDAIANML
ncbi:MAG: aldo/keto reductase [Bacteroidaceae bacterium]|nr:aldo/keto reductase [Bacteroidaceae bacterium]